MDLRRTEAADGGLRVIGMVASTGALDALSQVLVPLPAGFPGAVVALQHTRPEHTSRLAEILGRRTALSVQPAQDGGRLRPDRPGSGELAGLRHAGQRHRLRRDRGPDPGPGQHRPRPEGDGQRLTACRDGGKPVKR